MTALTRIAAANGIAAGVARVIALLISIVLTPIILGGIGAQLYGVLTVAGSFYDYLTLFRGGLGTAMRRHVTIGFHRGDAESAAELYQAGFWWGAILRMPILVLAMALAGPLCDFVQVPAELRSEAVLGMRLVLFAAWIGDFSAMFEVPVFASGATAIISYLRSGVGLLRLIVMMAAFSLLVPSLELYGNLLIGLTVVSTVGMGVFAQRAKTVGSAIPRLRVGTPAVRRELFSYGGLALLGQVGELLWVATDTLLIGRLFGPAEITLFSFGARWMPLLRQSWTSILRSIQPLFTKLEAEQTTDRSRRATEQTVALSAGVSVPACLVPCVVGKIFLVHWVGVEYTSAYPIILITLIPLSLELTLYPIWVVLAARGRIGWVSVAELVLATTRIGASLFLAVGLSQGILGFAWASAGALLARNLLIRPLATRDLDALPSTYRLLLSYLRAVAGAAPALILLWLAQPLYRDSLAAVVIAGMLGGALALAGAITASFGRSGLLRLRKGIMSRA